MNKIVSELDLDPDNDTSVNLTQSYETVNIVLINNNTDDDQVILGVLAPQDSENDTIEMQASFSISKSSFKMDGFTSYNFVIDDENATCNFCTYGNSSTSKK